MSSSPVKTARPACPGGAGRGRACHAVPRPGAGHWLSVVRTASGGMLRHKVQSMVIVAVLFIATASATLGLALLNANNSPFARAFAAQHGADATVTVNPARATAAQLAATAHAAGVTAMAGPFNETTLPLEYRGFPGGPTTLVGRSAPGGAVDDLVLTAGHWADGPGQLVLNGNPQSGSDNGASLGDTFTATSLPGAPVLTVVGFASSVTNTAQGWVTPGELSGLLAAGSQPAAELLYRFDSAATSAQLRADVAAVGKTLPAGTIIDWSSWLTAQQSEGSNAAIMEPFVVAFALIGLVMAVLIVGNVISGAVIAQYQRIGVLKSLGLTPAQVVAVYLSRIGWPALAVLPRRRGRRVPAVSRPCCASRPRPTASAGAGAGLGADPRAGRHARHHPARRVRPGAAGRAAVGGDGDRLRARSRHRPWIRRPPAGRAAQRAAPGQPRSRRAVLPARPHPGHLGRDRVRVHRGDLRGRAAVIAERRAERPDPGRHSARSRPAEQPWARTQRGAHRRPDRYRGRGDRRAAGHRA